MRANAGLNNGVPTAVCWADLEVPNENAEDDTFVGWLSEDPDPVPVALPGTELLQTASKVTTDATGSGCNQKGSWLGASVPQPCLTLSARGFFSGTLSSGRIEATDLVILLFVNSVQTLLITVYWIR